MAALVTLESVSISADSIRASGGKPSVRSVRNSLGGGSPNMILKFLNEWNAAQTLVKKDRIQINPKIQELIAQQIEQEASAVQRDKDQEIASLQEDMEELGNEGRRLEQEIAQVRSQCQAETARANNHLGQIEELNKHLARTIHETEAARRENAVNTARLEELQRRLAESDAIRDQLNDERNKRVEAERKLAALEAKSTAEASHFHDLQSTLKAHDRTIRNLEQRLADDSASRDVERRQAALKIEDLEQRLSALSKNASIQEII